MFTTLKALKWSYDLGARQERVRISAHLQAKAQGARINNEVLSNMLNEEMSRNRPRKSTMERLQFDQAVNHRVGEIIDEIFNPSGEWTPPASIMFPNDNHKGEI